MFLWGAPFSFTLMAALTRKVPRHRCQAAPKFVHLQLPPKTFTLLGFSTLVEVKGLYNGPKNVHLGPPPKIFTRRGDLRHWTLAL
ncbi:protein of unknown function (plasmid) [Cupriavidus taiwanensis]|uniref:Uncharacterized protein n=1 Tax=Cupriavidus taiwanensis TaxID=164546 RepID=A0A7Z7NRA0_9BURK|nr:hypothetical protein CBM2597_U30056 [Cupriavidus taiwanensis]SOZ97001.1 hypothetical protein CBM2598_U30060 [Cupriavidus taiwanensis]SPC25924.1 hypothetical protein CBM2594_U20111 [Cupriavidus taiwanensis]SPD38051.1 protein of unknown function [Cupriavidus taiwanensis]